MRMFKRVLLAIAFGIAAGPALAVDGVVLIDQVKALAGGVTPGDTPGFPVYITTPGSYRLTSNLVVTNPEESAIEVRAPNVTIDLNGFSISGPGVRNTSRLSGLGVSSIIYAPGGGNPLLTSPYVTVANGTITGMGAGGLLLDRGSVVKNMRIHDNFGAGIEVSAGTDNSLIADNVLANNILFGTASGDILTLGYVVIRGNTATGTISALCPSVVVGNVARVIDVSGPGCTRDQNAPAP